MRLTIKALLLATALVLVAGTTARADPVTQFEWDRTGAEALPCASDVQWVLAPADTIDNATVGINDADDIPDGHAWTMIRNWEDMTLYITTTEPVATTDEVLLAYVGTAEVEPTLTLVGCTPAEVVVPPPSGGGGGTTETPAPTQQALVWSIGFTVSTIRPTNVLAKWRVVCSNATTTLAVKGKVRARTPLTRHLAPTLEDATYCHLRVRAYDIKPHVRPHNWPAPVVTTWVTSN